MSVPNPHRYAEIRSIELHRAVARRLREQPELLKVALERVEGWLGEHPIHRYYAKPWHDLLTGPFEVLLDKLIEDSEMMRDMRQSSPFAGIIDQEERLRIIRETSARFRAHEPAGT